MKKLQCEICGGTLVMQDGIAECQSCGMKFSKEEVKKMVVELSGPIQIDGEVKVSGVEDADVLYRRAKDAERIGELADAYYTYLDATKKYPGDARLWLGWATVQVKVRLKKCEDELEDDYYYDLYFRDSFMDSSWCDEIEKSYARAQSLGGVDDEAQQGLLWFRNQKEILIQKYKDKKRKSDTYYYWEKANAEFLNSFPGSKVKEEILAFLLKQDVREVCEALKKTNRRYNSYRIESFKYAQGRSISFEYWYYDNVSKSYPTIVGEIDLPEGMTIEGDIRPMMDGFTYKKKGLFAGKTTYSYANDPDKDKGPVFEFDE